jgi:hypothetical protein
MGELSWGGGGAGRGGAEVEGTFPLPTLPLRLSPIFNKFYLTIFLLTRQIDFYLNQTKKM